MAVNTVSQSAEQATARERVELVIAQLDQLPTLPAIAAQLLQLTISRDSSARDVVALIESDPALTATLLKMVRRADLGLRHKAMTVTRAVTLLGFTAVRNLVLSVQLYDTFEGADRAPKTAEMRRELWKHALAVACSAEMVMDAAFGPALAGDAFVCGLLHDIGKIALDSCLPKSYARVVERVEQEHACICDIEKLLFGLDHTVAGRHLAVRWKLADPIVESIWLHHQERGALPSSVCHADLIQVVRLADNLVRRQHIGFSGYQHVADVERIAAAFGITAARVQQIVDRLPERVAPFFEFIGLDDGSGRSIYAQSLAKANAELGRLNAELSHANQRLARRSTCYEALARFTQALTDQHRLADVCAVAADVVAQLVQADAAVAFAGDRTSRCVHTGFYAAEADTVTSPIELSADQHALLLSEIGHAEARSGFVLAAHDLDTLWRHVAGRPPSGALWLLPFKHGDALLGGVMFVAQEELPDVFRSVGRECDALATAIALAAASARARATAERINEELLDANRRLSAAQSALVRARSISMVGEMAAGAAHELHNPLAVISGRAQMELQNTDDEDLRRSLTTVKDQAQRASQIVMELMDFAKPQAPQPQAQRLADVIESLRQHWGAGSTARPGQLSMSLADPQVSVYADHAQLRQILDALVSNAIDACEPETLHLQINSPSRLSDGTVRIVIEDNGVGMPRDVLERAFDPFYSNRPAGRGRGLGLSRAYRLAEINGGRLWLASTPNVGTTATVELPARPPKNSPS